LEFNVPFQHKYGYIRDKFAGEPNKSPFNINNARVSCTVIGAYVVGGWRCQ